MNRDQSTTFDSPSQGGNGADHSVIEPRDTEPQTEQTNGMDLARFEPETTQPLPDDAASPSLLREAGDKTPAFEMKFLLSEQQAQEVQALLRDMLAADPHSAAQDSGGYSLTTLYCDTPQWDVYHRNGRYGLFKFRLRRYGRGEWVYLERKSKRGRQVRKRRNVIPLEQLSRLADAPNGAWEGGWYHRQLRRNQFRPVCLIEYQRDAYFGHGNEGPLRLTFDRGIAGSLTDGWSFEHQTAAKSMLSDQVVCEFKFKGPLPSLFKSVIHQLQLLPRGISKYRHCLQAFALAELGGAADA